ncbi:MAG: ester cyclase, partial [Saprospiraceae bacterium]|nr:ester cyclase [Saprospiraceae bacterium]
MAGLPNPAAFAELNIRSMLAAADKGDIEKFISYWAPDGKNYFTGKETSMEDMKKRIAAFKAGFPDIKRTLDKVVVSGNIVTLRGWVTGTNTGMFRGQPGTGNAIKLYWLGFYELNEQGKIKAGYVEFDTATLESQLKGTVASK